MATKFGDSPISAYVIHKIEENLDGYNYYLYVHPKGQAIIMREKIDNTEYLYAKAGSGLNNKWATKNMLDYITYDQLDAE